MAKNYKDIHRDFNQKLAKEWEEQGFSFEQTADWVNIYSPKDQVWAIKQPYYHAWLRDIKNLDCEQVLNYGNDKALREEYKDWQLKELTDLKTPTRQPTNFSWKPLITIALAGLTIYLLIKYYD